ncbi:MFS transporter [Corynebacterium riegelii]|uniref:MFS transporter n=1 Tax=Corynebacterium riegelii TaxID=156976 RepID=UPI00215219FF|nr:MFS transporter [Corynebacterium riegelii]
MQIVPLMAMSFAAFVYVTYEMFAIGLISPMAVDLGVTEGQIGLLMTVYAGLVAVVTIPLMHYTRRMNRRPLFIATLVFLLTGIVLQAIATSYPMLVVGRVTAAFTHGLFWSLVNPMAARLAPTGQMGKAVAAVSFGSTMSTVLGAPLTTAVGHAIGWRNATWLLGVGAIVAFLLLLKTLPSMPAKLPTKTTSVQKTKSALPSLVFYLTFSVTALFATFTYLALLLQDTAGERWVAPGLALYGVVGIIFVVVAGRRVDARMIRLNGFDALFLMTSAFTGLLALQQQSGVLMFVAVALLGMSSGTLPTAATTIFMHAGKGNQDMASSIYVVTFQVGIAAGSALGAATVDAGYLSGTLLITLVLGAAALVTLVGFSRPRLR